MRPFLARVRSSIRNAVIELHSEYLRRIWQMDIGKGARISFKAVLDKTNPRGIHIGKYTGVSFNAVILSHDFIRNRSCDTWIGACCQIGAQSIIYPGVRIGDKCIVASGAVVMTNVPDQCIVSGNPARIVERDINPGKFGIRVDVIPPERLDPRMIVQQDAL